MPTASQNIQCEIWVPTHPQEDCGQEIDPQVFTTITKTFALSCRNHATTEIAFLYIMHVTITEVGVQPSFTDRCTQLCTAAILFQKLQWGPTPELHCVPSWR
jgi:hypothetical protein